MKKSSSFLIEKLLEKTKFLEAKVKDLEGLEQEVSELRAENVFLRKENAELKDKINLNSKNSSIPSSKELYKQKRSEKKSGGRKRGGQPGHKGHYRKDQEPNEIVEVELEDKFCECGGEFCKAGDPEVQQKVDIPKIEPYIINYVLNYYRCNKCGVHKKAKLPPGVTADVFGHNVKTIIAALTTFYKNSKRDVQKILRDIFNVEISLGCISNNEGRVSKKCQEAYENVESEVQNGTVVHMDETSHRKGEKKGWCWFFGTTTSSLVKFSRS